MSQLAIQGGIPAHQTGWPAWPSYSQLEEDAILRVLRSGEWWKNSMGESILSADTGEQPKSAVGNFALSFSRFHGSKYGICAANGTVALEVALRAAGIEAGDEVIVPPYTFIATASAPLLIGAVPVFADIEPDTCNIDPEKIKAAITGRTKAIIPVHFGGLPANMDAILKIAREYGLSVIEDCAHAHGGSYKGKKCGSIGDLGAFSFQGSKNITAGEGGIIITDRREYAQLSESYIWGGRTLDSSWYGHVNLGSNLRMTEFQGAILSAQLQRLPEWFATRSRNAKALNDCLALIRGVKPMASPPAGSENSYHLFLFRYFPAEFGGLPKQKFVEVLQAEGIPAMVGYEFPLYKNRLFTERHFWGKGYPFVPGIYDRKIDYLQFEELCPVSEHACLTEIVWLPQNCLLSDEAAILDIAHAIEKIQAHYPELI